MSSSQEQDFVSGGERGLGVIYGITIRDPQSATLTATIEGGVARVYTATLGKKFDEVNVAATTKAFTASKDTYVILKTDGTLGYTEVAVAAAKPSKATIETAHGTGAQFIAKVTTDGSRVTDGGVVDLRKFCAHGELEVIELDVSFETGEAAVIARPMPYSGRLLYLSSTVTKAIAATDAGTVTVAVGLNGKYTNVTGGLLTYTLSSAINTRFQAVTTALRDFTAGGELRFTVAKTTAGGKAAVFAVVEKLPK